MIKIRRAKSKASSSMRKVTNQGYAGGVIRRALTLVEVLFATLIIVVGGVTVLLLIPEALRGQESNRFKLVAAMHAQSLIEGFINHGYDFQGVRRHALTGNDAGTVDEARRGLHYSLNGSGARIVDMVHRPFPDLASDDQSVSRLLQSFWRILGSTGQFDLEQLLTAQGAGLYPLPPSIARRLDSENDEIRRLLDNGGNLYYLDAEVARRFDAQARRNQGIDSGFANPVFGLVVGIIGDPVQNLLPLNPMAEPIFEYYPFPPQHNDLTGDRVYQGRPLDLSFIDEEMPLSVFADLYNVEPAYESNFDPDGDGIVVLTSVVPDPFDNSTMQVSSDFHAFARTAHGHTYEAPFFRSNIKRGDNPSRDRRTFYQQNVWEYSAWLENRTFEDSDFVSTRRVSLHNKWRSGLTFYRRLANLHWARVQAQVRLMRGAKYDALNTQGVAARIRPGWTEQVRQAVTDTSGDIVTGPDGRPVTTLVNRVIPDQEQTIPTITQAGVLKVVTSQSFKNTDYVIPADEIIRLRGWPTPANTVGFSTHGGSDVLFEDESVGIDGDIAETLRQSVPSLERRIQYRSAALALWASVACVDAADETAIVDIRDPRDHSKVMLETVQSDWDGDGDVDGDDQTFRDANVLGTTFVGPGNVTHVRHALPDIANPLLSNWENLSMVRLSRVSSTIAGSKTFNTAFTDMNSDTVDSMATKLTTPASSDWADFVHPAQIYALSYLADAAVRVTGYKPPFYSSDNSDNPNDFSSLLPSEDSYAATLAEDSWRLPARAVRPTYYADPQLDPRLDLARNPTLQALYPGIDVAAIAAAGSDGNPAQRFIALRFRERSGLTTYLGSSDLELNHVLFDQATGAILVTNEFETYATTLAGASSNYSATYNELGASGTTPALYSAVTLGTLDRQQLSREAESAKKFPLLETFERNLFDNTAGIPHNFQDMVNAYFSSVPAEDLNTVFASLGAYDDLDATPGADKYLQIIHPRKNLHLLANPWHGVGATGNRLEFKDANILTYEDTIKDPEDHSENWFKITWGPTDARWGDIAIGTQVQILGEQLRAPVFNDFECIGHNWDGGDPTTHPYPIRPKKSGERWKDHGDGIEDDIYQRGLDDGTGHYTIPPWEAFSSVNWLRSTFTVLEIDQANSRVRLFGEDIRYTGEYTTNLDGKLSVDIPPAHLHSVGLPEDADHDRGSNDSRPTGKQLSNIVFTRVDGNNVLGTMRFIIDLDQKLDALRRMAAVDPDMYWQQGLDNDNLDDYRDSRRSLSLLGVADIYHLSDENNLERLFNGTWTGQTTDPRPLTPGAGFQGWHSLTDTAGSLNDPWVAGQAGRRWPLAVTGNDFHDDGQANDGSLEPAPYLQWTYDFNRDGQWGGDIDNDMEIETEDDQGPIPFRPMFGPTINAFPPPYADMGSIGVGGHYAGNPIGMRSDPTDSFPTDAEIGRAYTVTYQLTVAHGSYDATTGLTVPPEWGLIRVAGDVGNADDQIGTPDDILSEFADAAAVSSADTIITDTEIALRAHENSLRLAVNYTSQNPYDQTVPRPLNVQNFVQRPLTAFDLFDQQATPEAIRPGVDGVEALRQSYGLVMPATNKWRVATGPTRTEFVANLTDWSHVFNRTENYQAWSLGFNWPRWPVSSPNFRTLRGSNNTEKHYRNDRHLKGMMLDYRDIPVLGTGDPNRFGPGKMFTFGSPPVHPDDDFVNDGGSLVIDRNGIYDLTIQRPPSPAPGARTNSINGAIVEYADTRPWQTTLHGPYMANNTTTSITMDHTVGQLPAWYWHNFPRFYHEWANRLHGYRDYRESTGAIVRTTDNQAGNAWQLKTRNADRFLHTKPFDANTRIRQLVYWRVDWQNYEDFEEAPGAPLDYSRSRVPSFFTLTEIVGDADFRLSPRPIINPGDRFRITLQKTIINADGEEEVISATGEFQVSKNFGNTWMNVEYSSSKYASYVDFDGVGHTNIDAVDKFRADFATVTTPANGEIISGTLVNATNDKRLPTGHPERNFAWIDPERTATRLIFDDTKVGSLRVNTEGGRLNLASSHRAVPLNLTHLGTGGFSGGSRVSDGSGNATLMKGALEINAAIDLVPFGADRNSNGQLDRGKVSRNQRMQATVVARFNFYDPVQWTSFGR